MTVTARPDTFSPGPEHAYPAFLADGDAVCAGLPLSLADDFTLDAHTIEQKHRVDRAAMLCQGCPFKLRCRAWAIEHHPQVGVYGGTTLKQREGLRAAARTS